MPADLLPAQSDLELRLHAVVTLRPRSRPQSPPNSHWIESAYTLYYVRGARLVATERGEGTSAGACSPLGTEARGWLRTPR
jgi:hypothetical protein